MKFGRPLGALAVVVFAGMWSGCSCASERVSDAATSPVGRWNRATATVEYHPSFYKNRKQHAASVTHSLSIEQADKNRAYVILSMHYKDVDSPELFREMRETKYTLKFAPDDSALAVSTDGGHTFTLFDLDSLLDTTKDPFWCRHRSVSSLTPWPSMRGLALEVLGTVDPTSPNAGVHRGEGPVEWPGAVHNRSHALTWNAEILGASRYACVHREDPELRTALVDAFVHKDYGSSKVDVDECMGQLANVDPAIRSRLQDSLVAADFVGKARVASAFYYADRPATGKAAPPSTATLPTASSASTEPSSVAPASTGPH